MNWVGGSRSRYMKNKEDAIKQRAFFQKQRMKIKPKYMDLPKGQNSGNTDLLTLFIVNQIASKKEKQSNTGKPNLNQMTGAKRTKKPFDEPLEFPMSTCPPSDLNLVASQPKYRVDTPFFKTRKYRLSEELKFKPLSPVLESNLSDTSGSESQGQPSRQPTPHPPEMKNTPQMANLWSDVSYKAPMKDVPHTSPAVGIRFEKTLLNQEMGEHSATSLFYPLRPLKSSEQPEEPLFINFKNMDCEMLDSLNSSDIPQNIDNDGHFLKQEFICTDRNTCADGGSAFVRPYESSRGVYLSNEAKRHDGNLPVIFDAGTQTEALTYCDVSVQCSLIPYSDAKSFPAAHQESSILTTRRRSFNLKQFVKLTTLSSPKDGQKTTGNSSSGASARNQQAQRHPKSQTGLSSCRLRSQKALERDVMPVLKHSLPKASEQIKQQRWHCTVKTERRDDPRLENVTRNPVQDVRRAGEPAKEKKKV